MDDDDDDDGLDAESVAKNTEIRTAIKQAQSGMPYKRDCEWAIIFVGLGRQSVQKLEMKTAIRKSYRSKTLRLMNNTMTDTPPGHTLFYTRAIRGGVAGPGWASNRVVDSILKF